VLHLLLAGWVQQALLDFALQHSLPLAYARLASIAVNMGIFGPTLFQHSLHIPNYFPMSGFATLALGSWICSPPCTAAAEGVCYSKSRRGHSTI
jgi:hypothetical protein